jgi:hypothetical protein
MRIRRGATRPTAPAGSTVESHSVQRLHLRLQSLWCRARRHSHRSEVRCGVRRLTCICSMNAAHRSATRCVCRCGSGRRSGYERAAAAGRSSGSIVDTAEAAHAQGTHTGANLSQPCCQSRAQRLRCPWRNAGISLLQFGYREGCWGGVRARPRRRGGYRWQRKLQGL